MVQIGTPEQYFAAPQEIVIREPVPTRITEPIMARVIEPVTIQQAQLQDNNTPLILAICLLGAVSLGLVIVLGLHIWVSGRRS